MTGTHTKEKLFMVQPQSYDSCTHNQSCDVLSGLATVSHLWPVATTQSYDYNLQCLRMDSLKVHNCHKNNQIKSCSNPPNGWNDLTTKILGSVMVLKWVLLVYLFHSWMGEPKLILKLSFLLYSTFPILQMLQYRNVFVLTNWSIHVFLDNPWNIRCIHCMRSSPQEPLLQ